MKKIWMLLCTTLLLASCTEEPVATPDRFIRVEGEDLVAPDGSKFFIKGTNLGCWLNPEGYMFGFGRASSARLINEMFCEMVGPDRTAEFWKRFKDNYVTRADVEFIASCGANTIRIPFNYRVFTDEDYLGLTAAQDGFARIDSVVKWCGEFGLHVILDMHAAPGGQTGDNIDDSYGYPWLFESRPSQELFCDIWGRIADHYKDEPVVLGYELMNEPIAPYFDTQEELNAKFLPLCKEAVARIRQFDTNHIIVLGCPQWNTNFKPVTDWKFDDKMMLTCHRYGGEAGVEGIRDYIAFRDSTGLPMYMGEIGHNTMEWQTTYSRVMRENNIGYTFWPYKKRDTECMVAFDVPQGWDEIVVPFAEGDRQDFGKVRALRPDQEKVWKAMCELTENLRFEKCHPLEAYIGSMMLKE